MKNYTTLKSGVYENEIVIEKSRFIAFACSVSNVGQANLFIESVSKKHYDATHNCYAYVTADGQKFSDDGEPQGTAGMPILNAIKGRNLSNVAVVVTRYFGGIKLGAGGLVRAYGNSAGEVLDMAQKSEVKFCKVFCIRCAYSVACVCESVIQTFGKTVEKEYYDQVKLKAAVPEEFAEKFKEEITDKTNGKIEMEEISNGYIEF